MARRQDRGPRGLRHFLRDHRHRRRTTARLQPGSAAGGYARWLPDSQCDAEQPLPRWDPPAEWVGRGNQHVSWPEHYLYFAPYQIPLYRTLDSYCAAPNARQPGAGAWVHGQPVDTLDAE